MKRTVGTVTYSPKLLVGALMILVAPAVSAGQTNTMVMDSDGRVILPFSRSGSLNSARVDIQGAADQAGKLVLHCRPLPSFDNTAEPSDTDAPVASVVRDKDLVFEIHVKKGDPPFLFCSLLRPGGGLLTPGDKAAQDAKLKTATEALTKLALSIQALTQYTTWNESVAAVEAATAKQAREVPRLRATAKAAGEGVEAAIKALQADIAAFQQKETEGAVAEIKRLQEEVRKVRTKVTDAADTLAKGEKELTDTLEEAEEMQETRLRELVATPVGKQWAQAERDKAEAETRLDAGAQEKFTVLNYSHLFIGRDETPIYYRLLRGKPIAPISVGAAADVSTASAAQPLRADVVALERAASYPVLTTESRIYAVIINRRRAELPEPFRLTFTQTAGSPPDPAPVRPTFPATGQAGSLRAYSGLDTAYGDFVMSFGAPFKANSLIKATISTVLSQTTENSTTTTTKEGKTENETKKVVQIQKAELLKDEEYPQVRGLYHFNFTTGVAVSGVRDASFVRRQTVLDDPATPDKNEAEYQDQTVGGDRSVKPMFAISVYLKPIDIQKKLSWQDRFRPAVVLGFSFEKPQDNVYIGGAIEPVKSLQVLFGLHLGKVTEKREPTAIDDSKSSAAPATDQRYQKAFFAGLSFNIGFIKSIFGS